MREGLGHIPVLLDEVLAMLAPAPGEAYADLTAGLGGHARAVAGRLGPAGRVALFDLDAENLAHAAGAVRATGVAVTVRHGNFAGAAGDVAAAIGPADLVLADLGFASTQVDDPSRGLSFRHDAPLDMRLDRSSPVTAATLLAEADEPDLARILREYGEERFAGRVARKLVEARREHPIDTTGVLARLVRAAVPAPKRGAGRPSIDAATRTFQALRIAVNDELGSLERLLAEIRAGAEAAAGGRPTWLASGARVVVISFHSLEDRPVKHAFRALVDDGLAEALTRKAVRPGEAETATNPRARSAKLRAIRVALRDS